MNAAARILLIDSNVFFAKRLADALKHEGFEVTHATAGAYALTDIEWNAPAAIVCSTKMREMGAYEIAGILHNDIRNAHIPIIALGEGGDHSLMEAFRAGCDEYVDRRVGPEQIAAHVKAFLRSHDEGFQPTQMIGSSDTALSGSLSHLDLPGVIQMLCHSRQNGALHVNAGDMDGILFFDAGEVWHAECGDLIGDDAMVSIVKSCANKDNGVYKFVPGATAATRTVLRSATELMMEALRELDEQQARLAEGGLL